MCKSGIWESLEFQKFQGAKEGNFERNCRIFGKVEIPVMVVFVFKQYIDIQNLFNPFCATVPVRELTESPPNTIVDMSAFYVYDYNVRLPLPHSHFNR